MDTNNVEEYQVDDLGQKGIPLGIQHVSLLFSLMVLGILFIGFRAQQRNLISGLVITQAVTFLFPIILLIVLKNDISKTLRLNPVSLSNILLVIGMMPFALLTVALINLPYILLIQKIFGKTIESTLPIPESVGAFLMMFLIVGVLAGICEEVLFRGVILRGFEGLGAWPAILISSILFGLIHFDFQKLLSTTLLGVIIGFIVYRTNSLFAGMVAHSMNNVVAFSLTSIIIRIQQMQNISPQGMGQLQAGDITNIAPLSTTGIKVYSVIFVILMAILLFVLPFIRLLVLFIRRTQNVYKKDDAIVQKQKLFPEALWLIPGLLIIGIVYVAIALALLDMDLSVVASFIKIFFVK